MLLFSRIPGQPRADQVAINDDDLRNLQRRAAELLADAQEEQRAHGDSQDGRQSRVNVMLPTPAEAAAEKRRRYLVEVLNATVSGLGQYFDS
jgi:hypothetical protein